MGITPFLLKRFFKNKNSETAQLFERTLDLVDVMSYLFETQFYHRSTTFELVGISTEKKTILMTSASQNYWKHEAVIMSIQQSSRRSNANMSLLLSFWTAVYKELSTQNLNCIWWCYNIQKNVSKGTQAWENRGGLCLEMQNIYHG